MRFMISAPRSRTVSLLFTWSATPSFLNMFSTSAPDAPRLYTIESAFRINRLSASALEMSGALPPFSPVPPFQPLPIATPMPLLPTTIRVDAIARPTFIISSMVDGCATRMSGFSPDARRFVMLGVESNVMSTAPAFA